MSEPTTREERERWVYAGRQEWEAEAGKAIDRLIADLDRAEANLQWAKEQAERDAASVTGAEAKNARLCEALERIEVETQEFASRDRARAALEHSDA